MNRDVRSILVNRQEEGRQHGFRQGYADGYRLGLGESIVAKATFPASMPHDLRVLYIPQGFDAIDRGVSVALSKLTKEFVSAEASQMLATAEQMRPDVVLVMNGLHVFPADHLEHLTRLRELGIKSAVWFVDDPYFTEDTAKAAPYYDMIFTHERACLPFYASLGCFYVLHLPLGVGTSTFHPVRTAACYKYDICFIGNAFWNRARLFDELAPYLLRKKVIIAGGHWDRLTQYAQLKPLLREGWVPIEETVHYYNAAKIVINMHRPSEYGLDNRNSFHITGQSLNPRTYEIAACGTLQLIDSRSELLEMYTPGFDIDTFETAAELIHKLDYYLNHESERFRIAMNGLQTTFQRHTFEHRVDQMLRVMKG
ncbi:CgeB family protein [Paenibacillus sp. 481]|uniref:CgeB family protein n=1 Tax=Paenibacillus sp. 481 TaxID=2835869 RepID=UPI001E5246A2|nr:glycosyltransferase [Paenibacillus sp. 481]